MIWSYLILLGGTIIAALALSVARRLWNASPREVAEAQERAERRRVNQRIAKILRGKP